MDVNTVMTLTAVAFVGLAIMILLLVKLRRQRGGALPDGDYEIEQESVDEGLDGTVTTYKVVSPKAQAGRRFRVKQTNSVKD